VQVDGRTFGDGKVESASKLFQKWHEEETRVKGEKSIDFYELAEVYLLPPTNSHLQASYIYI